jgi:hypothetical protein
VIFCIANVFNLPSKFVLSNKNHSRALLIIKGCCVKRFHRLVFDEGNYNDKHIEQGREILKHERELWERGINTSHINVKKKYEVFLTLF